MKAFVLEKYGQPLRAVNMPIPEPGPRQVLVSMAASGVNHADERTRVGEFKAVFRLDLPKVMGGELSGEVIALGSQVTEFAVGDKVYGYTGVVGMGTWAETVAVDVDALAHAPPQRIADSRGCSASRRFDRMAGIGEYRSPSSGSNGIGAWWRWWCRICCHSACQAPWCHCSYYRLRC